jgi:Flp pilus assembly protein TadG
MKRIIHRTLGLKSERGAALVEFALVVPFLMLIMCATIDFGLAVYTLNNLTAAVREGGRYAATMSPAPVANDPFVVDRVWGYIAGMNNGNTAAVNKATISSTAPDGLGNITVRITNYQYRPVTPLATAFGISTLSLNRTAIFRWERSS